MSKIAIDCRLHRGNIKVNHLPFIKFIKFFHCQTFALYSKSLLLLFTSTHSKEITDVLLFDESLQVFIGERLIDKKYGINIVSTIQDRYKYHKIHLQLLCIATTHFVFNYSQWSFNF